MRRRRGLLGLGIWALAACSSGPSSPSDKDFAAAFDTMWNAFEAQYPYFDFKAVDWNAQRARYRPRAAAAQTLDEFLGVIRETVEPLRDAHAWLESPSGGQEPTYLSDRFVNWDREVWLEYIQRSPYRRSMGFPISRSGAGPRRSSVRPTWMPRWSGSKGGAP